jgi:hypothetical protein
MLVLLLLFSLNCNNGKICPGVSSEHVINVIKFVYIFFSLNITVYIHKMLTI